MNLDFVEVCGFRGFRDELRLEFAPGFTVISGRNGVGKSTVCDAIEFALTGDIDKYRVEKAARESLADYLWWRGDGKPAAHYVTVGFSGAKGGEPFVITRTRETGPSQTGHRIEEVLCVVGAKPDKAVQQVCRTSIIRDEWIAALSLDLSETERFELVRAALGAIDGPDYATKAKLVLSAAEGASNKAQRWYEEGRIRLGAALTELAETKDRALKAGDVAQALAVLNAESVPSTDELLQRISTARSQLTSRRMRLGGMGRAIEEAKEIATSRAVLESPEFQTRKTETEAAVADLLVEREKQQNVFAEVRRELVREQERDAIAADLAVLLEHGSRLGLNDGHCPLCNATRTVSQFKEGIAATRARLAALGSGVAAVRRRVRETEENLATINARLGQKHDELAELARQGEVLREREEAHMKLLQQYGLDPALQRDGNGLEEVLRSEQSRLVDLERSILTLETSQAVGRVTELEARVTSLRREADSAADQLAKTQVAVTTAKGIDRAVRRTNAEVMDERLAVISPLLNELYQRLRPHADWRSIEYRIRGDVKRFLSLRVGDALNPQFVFSSGQRRAAGLAFLLSVHLSRPWCRWNTLVLDDPMQHIDDYRALHLAEILAAIRWDERQIVCAVEDASLADLLCRRLISTASSPGQRIDLDFDPSGAAVAKVTAIPPMPANALNRTVGVSALG